MQQRGEETRTRILGASLKLFANYGFNAASVDNICTDAGISKGAFYHHFPSKQAVFLDLLEGWLATIDVGLEAMRKETVPETLLSMTETLPYIFTSAGEHLPMFLEFWLQASRDEEIWQATIDPYRRYQKYFTRMIEQGMAEGSFKEVDAKATAEMIVSFAVGMLLQGLMDRRGKHWEKVARESVQVILKGLER